MNSTYSIEEIDVIWQRYPSLSTIADIFTQAIASSDIDTIRLISFYNNYLPITWNLYIDTPTNILSLFQSKISPDLVAYRLQDIQAISKYPINYKLAIKYNIISILRESSISIQVQGLSPDDIIPRITTASVEEYLEQSLIYGRVDLVKAIRNKYGKMNLDLLITKYWDVLSVPMIIYLRPEYPQLQQIIIYDDPSLISRTYLSESQIQQMFKYDLVKIYDKYGAGRISPFAYGNIKRRILENNSNIQQLQILAPHLLHSDILLGLQIYHNNRDLRLFYLKVALNHEYMDILDKYMQKQDALNLYVHQPSDRLLNLLDYKYGDLGFKIQDGKLDEQLIMAAIQDRNVSFLKSILKYTPLPETRKKKLQLLLDQHQIELKV